MSATYSGGVVDVTATHFGASPTDPPITVTITAGPGNTIATATGPCTFAGSATSQSCTTTMAAAGVFSARFAAPLGPCPLTNAPVGMMNTDLGCLECGTVSGLWASDSGCFYNCTSHTPAQLSALVFNTPCMVGFVGTGTITTPSFTVAVAVDHLNQSPVR